MAEVYILYSLKLNRYYIGSCFIFGERFKQHLDKEMENSFTSKADDWELYYKVDSLKAEQARAIERHIKAMKSKTYIANLKAYPEIMEKLKEKFSSD
jgi:putative endonuclease